MNIMIGWRGRIAGAGPCGAQGLMCRPMGELHSTITKSNQHWKSNIISSHHHHPHRKIDRIVWVSNHILHQWQQSLKTSSHFSRCWRIRELWNVRKISTKSKKRNVHVFSFEKDPSQQSIFLSPHPCVQVVFQWQKSNKMMAKNLLIAIHSSIQYYCLKHYAYYLSSYKYFWLNL